MNRLSKSILTAAAILLTTLCRLTPAPAQDVFSALQGQGGVLVADPSCAFGNALGNGAICGVVGLDGHLYVNRFDGSGFTDLGGEVIGKPSCTHLGDAVQAFCGVRGLDSGVYVNFSSPFSADPSWSGFRPIGGVSISDPVCTGLFNPNEGQAICAIIRPNGTLAVSMTSNGSNWTAFEDLLGGTHIFNPTCTSFFNGGATPQSSGALCGAVTTAGDFRVKFFNGTTWDPAPTVITFPPGSNISMSSDPSCTFVGSGRQVICGVRGSDSALYVSQFNGSTFSQFQSLGGILFGAPSCTSENFGGNPMAVCAVRGLSSLPRHLILKRFFEPYVNQFNNGAWSGFQAIPGAAITGDPSCTIVPDNPPTLSAVVWCGIKSTDSSLWVTVGSP